MKKVARKMILMLLAATMIMTGCTKSGEVNDGEAVRIRIAWWGNQNRHNITQQALELFTQQNSNVVIEPEVIGSDVQHHEKLATQVAANSLPDIFQIAPFSASASSFIQKGHIKELTEYVNDKTLDFSDVPENIAAFGQMNGVQYTVPLGYSANCIILNEDIFEQANIPLPEEDYTWDDMFRIASEIHEATGKYGIYGYSATWIMDIAYAKAKGGRFYNEECTELGFSQEDYKYMLQKQYDMVKGGIIPTPEVISQVSGLEDDPFVRGEAAMKVIATNQYETLTTLLGGKTRMIYMPDSLSETKGQLYGSSLHMGISKNSKYGKECAQVLNFLTNDIEANKILNADRGIPISTKVFDVVRDQQSPLGQETFDFMEKIISVGEPDYFVNPSFASRVFKLGQDYEEKVVFDILSPEEASKGFFEEAATLIN